MITEMIYCEGCNNKAEVMGRSTDKANYLQRQNCKVCERKEEGQKLNDKGGEQR